MTSEEKTDLVLAQKQVAEKLKSMYDMMVMLDRAKPAELDNMGHPTAEAGIVWTFRDARKSIEKVWAAHLKKYPD